MPIHFSSNRHKMQRIHSSNVPLLNFTSVILVDLAGSAETQLWTRISMNLSALKSRRTLPKVNGRSVPEPQSGLLKEHIQYAWASPSVAVTHRLFSLSLSLSMKQAFNATAVVRHMRKLQLGTSLEGPSQITPTSPCHGHLLPEEEAEEEEAEEEEEDELGNGEEESCKSSLDSQQTNTIF